MIYLDHAANSWPKPREVFDAMADFPERAGHRLSIEAGRIDYNVRETLADFFNARILCKLSLQPMQRRQ